MNIEIKKKANEAISPLMKLNKTKSQQLINVFKPLTESLQELEEETALIMSEYSKGYTPELAKQAKAHRQKYVKIRTSTEKVKKDQKAELLIITKAIDGLYNIVKWATTSDEEKLKSIEKEEERIELEQLNKLQAERVALIAPYVEGAEALSLAEMDADVFESYLLVKKTKFEKEEADRLEAEKLAAEARKAEADRLEAQRLENIKLKAEAEEREEAEAIERKERAKAEAEARAEREAAEAKAKAELKKIADEKKAKAEAEAALLKAGDVEKFIELDKALIELLLFIEKLKISDEKKRTQIKDIINQALIITTI